MALNPQVKIPVKQNMMGIRVYFDDGTVVDGSIPASQRSNAIGILNIISPYITAPTGQNVQRVELEVGNGLDTAG